MMSGSDEPAQRMPDQHEPNVNVQFESRLFSLLSGKFDSLLDVDVFVGD